MSTSHLQLPGQVHVAASADLLYDQLAIALMSAAFRAVKERGVFHLALSGGSTPEPFYIRLVIDPRFRDIPWPKTHLWLVDERLVPLNHEQSNFNMIRQTLIDHVPIPPCRVHPMPTLSPESELEYERILAAEFGLRAPTGDSSSATANTAIPRLDFILLGMGDDGHTASLFPQSPALDETRRWIARNDGPTVTPPARITMTYPLLNAGRELAILVTGRRKAAALERVSRQIQQGGPAIRMIPITGIQPADGSLTWYLDKEAGSPAVS